MSVRVRLEIIVEGVGNPEALRDGLLASESTNLNEIGDGPIWQACQDADLDMTGFTIDVFEVEYVEDPR
jgi:hypothetical protein